MPLSCLYSNEAAAKVLQCGEIEIRPMVSMVGAGAQGAVYKTQALKFVSLEGLKWKFPKLC